MAGDVEKRLRRWMGELRGRVEGGADTSAVVHALNELDSALNQLLDDAFPSYSCPEEEWCTALRSQADDDLSAAITVNQAGGPPAVWAMLLQMAFEKYAKAAMARTDVQLFRRWRFSHAAASHFLRTLALEHGRLGLKPREARNALSAVIALERAHPALARRGPHLEYPWEDGGSVLLPSRHLQIVRELVDPKSAANAALLFRFAIVLRQRFDELFL